MTAYLLWHRTIALLESYDGQRMSSREIAEGLRIDCGPLYEPSNDYMNVIRLLAQLEEMHRVESDFDNTKKCTVWWRNAPKEDPDDPQDCRR
jgi:hypothetical protein